MKIKKQISQWPKIPFLLAGVLLVSFAVWSYSHYVNNLERSDYKIFALDKTISWSLDKGRVYRLSARGNLDNLLLSQDEWQEFELDFQMLNPHDCGVVFHYQDGGNFNFILFNDQVNAIIGGTKKDGTTQLLYRSDVPPAQYGVYKLTLNKTNVSLIFKGQAVASIQFPYRKGKFGIMINDARDPRTVFRNLTVAGTVADGYRIQSQMSRGSPSRTVNYVLYLLPFYCSLLLLSFYLTAWCYRCRDFLKKVLAAEEEERRFLNPWSIHTCHLLLACLVFFPFVSRGDVLVSSYDNLGEIFPLFFYSKHIFAQILTGDSLPLWNPYVHNGAPFFTNHWLMIYFPLNWFVFLVADSKVMSVLTLKSMIEVFLIGVFAYGFFKEELKSRKWALFCSVIYQLCSLLIFCLTIFPTLDLYFSMTMFLFLLWTVHRRTFLWNFIFLTLGWVCVLTSANVAFIFYAVVALGIVSVYRIASVKGEHRPLGILVGMSVLTGFLICAIRLLPCLWGIMESNRIIENFYTLHDRAFLIVRLFLPEIPGWFGTNTFNALTSPNLGLFFQELDLPSNTQNTFFVYFGIFAAVLLVLSLLTPTKEEFRFWKVYAWITIAVALLLQPFWGVLSILFFPFKHFSYHSIILPVGICTLVGYTGLHLEKNNFTSKQALIYILLFIQAYILVFITYAFPQLTVITRIILLIIASGLTIYFIARKYYPHIINNYSPLILLAFNAVGWVLLFVSSTVVLLRPLPQKELLAKTIVVPFFAIYAVLLAAMYGYGWMTREDEKKLLPLLPLSGVVVAVGIALGFIFNSPAFQNFLNLEDTIRTYATDLLLGHVKMLLLVQIVIVGFILASRKVISHAGVVILFVIVTALDLLAFNYRFDNITAPFFYNRAYYTKEFAYRDIDQAIKKRMDLVNYRVNRQDRAGLNANKGLIFNYPSYTGIIGYMPQRFANFAAHFGMSQGSILIYPSDEITSERFLDLSAVRYEFIDEQNFHTRKNALSRLNLFYSYEIADSEDQLLARLKEEAFDPQRTLLLTAAPENIFPAQSRKSSLRVPIVKNSYDEVTTHVKTAEPALLLFAESYDAGWTVFVDGKEETVIMANYNFMACRVDPGEHEIRFLYRPKRYYWARSISCFGIVVFVLCGLAAFRQRKWPQN